MKIKKVLLLRVSSATDKVDHPQFFDPCYQLKTIQAALEQRGDLEIAHHDCWIEPMSTEKLDAWAREVQPDLVVINATSFEVREANAFAAALKKWDQAPAIVGIGQGMYLNREWKRATPSCTTPSCWVSPRSSSRSCSSACSTTPTTAGATSTGSTSRKASASRSPTSTPCRSRPTRAKSSTPTARSTPCASAKRVLWGFLIAGRGCPYECSFCSEVMRVSVGKKMRIRSGKSVVDEMEHLVAQGANIISFQDDSFASSRALVRNVCNEIMARGVKIPWMARIRLDDVDYELLKMMAEAAASCSAWASKRAASASSTAS